MSKKKSRPAGKQSLVNALDDGTEPLGKRAFGQAMERHGYPSKVHGGMSVRMGLSFKNGAEK